MVEGSHRWLRIERRTGPDEAIEAWADALSGRLTPDVGIIIALD